MKTYTVTKDFYKLSEQKNYVVGDTIELSDEYALLLKDKVELIKEVKKAKKND